MPLNPVMVVLNSSLCGTCTRCCRNYKPTYHLLRPLTVYEPVHHRLRPFRDGSAAQCRWYCCTHAKAREIEQGVIVVSLYAPVPTPFRRKALATTFGEWQKLIGC